MPARTVAGRLLLVANVTAANALAAAVVVTFLRPTAVGAELPGPGQRAVVLFLDTGPAWAVLLAAVTLLAGNGWWLWRGRHGGPAPAHVTSEGVGGPVRVGRDALEAGLRQAGEALPQITRLRVVVDPGAGRRVLVTCQYQCAEGTSNLEAGQRLRTALQERFAAMVRLPEGARADFALEFTGFAGKLPRKAAEAAATEPAPFTGPQYPIDDPGEDEAAR